MAKLFCINDALHRPGINNIGDIVFVKPDDYVPAAGDLAFDVVIVSDPYEKVVEEFEKKGSLKSTDAEDWVRMPKYSYRVTDDSKATIAESVSINSLLA